MSTGLTIVCPIRGVLKTSAKSKDGLKPSEERIRVEAIKHLIKLGYPKDHFRIEMIVKKFGHGGKNSFRTDFVVLDVPAISIKSDVDTVLDHAIVLCEVKRESGKVELIKSTQVKPLLDFAKRDDSIAIYWDDTEQRVFWNERKGGKRTTKEGPLALLPQYGQQILAKAIPFSATVPSDNLLTLFSKIENLLHGATIDPEKRYNVMMQLILSKLFDEHSKVAKPHDDLEIQDYESLGFSGANALTRFNSVLKKAVNYYDKALRQPVPDSLPSKVTGNVLLEICKMFAPIRLIASKREVVQAFYMKFAKGLYKWDMAQFFTPPTVTDFIVKILNPQFGEHIKDPACGSADFLTAAFHIGRERDPNYASCVWGVDNSSNAVQVAILNMMLNGDGKSNIKEANSLVDVALEANKYEIVVCNPPFGVKITETNPEILKQFSLGHEWKEENGRLEQTPVLLSAQEIGILFLEVCVVQTKPGGRIGIILPNGYLGNTSKKYVTFRKWLMTHCRIAAICSFPRFTFKTSGADVSASIVYLEKRQSPLLNFESDDKYSFSVQMIEKVGWKLGDKIAAASYMQNPEDGTFIVDADGELLLDSDFGSAVTDLRNSQAGIHFPWLLDSGAAGPDGSGWGVSIENVLNDPYLTLDPKRHSSKYINVLESISKIDHFALGDIVDIIAEKVTSTGAKVKKESKKIYKYVQIADMDFGAYSSTVLRGWALPDRGKHFAEAGDLYVGSIWASVATWCIIPKGTQDTVVTNGCYRLRIKPGMEEFLPDLVSFICTENYRIQMRAIARGSDGMAAITGEDLLKVMVVKLSDDARNEVKPYVDNLLEGMSHIKAKVQNLQAENKISIADADMRSSHVLLV
jgi:type I restriction enzyme M protein